MLEDDSFLLPFSYVNLSYRCHLPAGPSHRSAEVIIGATTLDQLKENLDAFEGDAGLSEDVLQQIDEIHLKLRNPGTFL